MWCGRRTKIRAPCDTAISDGAKRDVHLVSPQGRIFTARSRNLRAQLAALQQAVTSQHIDHRWVLRERVNRLRCDAQVNVPTGHCALLGVDVTLKHVVCHLQLCVHSGSWEGVKFPPVNACQRPRTPTLPPVHLAGQHAPADRPAPLQALAANSIDSGASRIAGCLALLGSSRVPDHPDWATSATKPSGRHGFCKVLGTDGVPFDRPRQEAPG